MVGKGRSQKERILEYLLAVDMALSPYAISRNLGLNPNSVRARLTELARTGQVERVAPGLYSITSTHGVGKPPRIQNFTAVVHPEPRIVKSGRWEYCFPGPGGEVVLRLTFGLKRNKVTWTIKAPMGIDYYGLMFSYGLVRCELIRRGLTVSEEIGDPEEPRCFMVKVAELLDDRIGLGLDGLKCLTFRDLKGNLEKIYEKSYGLRREVRFTEPRPISEIMALYQGGLPSFMIAQASYDVARSVEQNTELLKYLHRNQIDLTRTTQAVLEALWKMVDNKKIDSSDT